MGINESSLPAIVLYGFASSEAVFSCAEGLNRRGYTTVIVRASDGATAASEDRFPGVTVIGAEHDDALRKGLERCNELRPSVPGVVMVRDDGYSLADVLLIADALAQHPDQVVVASRDGSGTQRGFACVECSVARAVFAVAHSRKVSDPWSGLIGLPAAHMAGFLSEQGKGEGYRFRLLLTMQRRGIQSVSVPVGAAYRREPGATTKSRVKDIAKIALTPLLFVSSSLTLMAADYSVSFLLYYVLLQGNKPVSVVLGRLTGAFIGFLINRTVVFRKTEGAGRVEAATIAKYAALFALMYCAALLLVTVMVDSLHIAFAVAQVIAGLLLYAPNYLIQRDFVFRNGTPKAKLAH